ncbi:TonB-dependent receptor [Glaciecola sp. XM2]|jgi:iron complex outermembrane receptor protein|uniref:TonB-dependent receptor n=1 Tax=Glaciecola sp. XM2 TaxID=1914931 RepID=UPI001BDEA758|nr:TonB-dependent receptor [Glaciecola sp. XM2]MBT1450334.1 TonB-dependent receptor [Glaciecola sp. XM2]
MKQFTPNLIKLALISSGFAFSAAALAQGAPAAEDEDQVELEIIQVSGIRGSLIRAQAIKMDNTSFVEALSAEDIGKLPDTSIAESLARLPGLAGERRNGRSSGLSVRGFNENYVATSLNGRELLGMGDNRGVEYDLYPSEIVANVLVYKSPEAGLLNQGIGGTVDLQTINPLGKDRTIVFNGSLEKNGMESGNPDFDDQGHRFSLNFVDSFADDTLGVAVTIASMESPSQEEHFRSWGYATVDTNSPRRAEDSVVVPEGTVVTGGHDSFVRSGLLERDSVAAVIQYAPTDDLMIKFDALYIDFQEDNVKRGLEEGGAVWGGQDPTITGVENGLVTSGFIDGFHSVVRNDASRQEAELSTFGLNVEYEINDTWRAMADISTGSVDKTITDIESYSGVGRAGVDGRPLTPRSFTMTDTGVMYSAHPTLPGVDLTDESLIRLAGPQAWGAPIIGSDAQDGFVNQPEFEEDLDSFRLQVNGDVEYGMIVGVEAGVAYSDRSKSKVNNGAYLTAPAYPGSDPIPNVLGVADLSFIGIEGVLAYDSLGLYNSGYYIATDAGLVQNDRLGDTYTVEEELTTLWVRADIDTEVGDMFLRGNFGLQAVSADQQSTGFSTVSDVNGRTVATPVTGGDDYTDLLPSMNLALEVVENQFVRLAMSKTISRPRMDDMRPNNQASFAFNDQQINSADPERSAWSGSSGNPALQPYEANQFDLAYENYFADSGYFSLSFFYKDIVNWHRTQSNVQDFSAVYIPSLHQSTTGAAPATFLGLVSQNEDGLEGFVRGYELQASLPFSILSDALEGFGVFASATFLDGEFEDTQGNITRVPGLSDESYQFTAFYEKAGFEARVSARKRDEFSTEVRGLSLALVETIDQGSTLVDAQIGYDFSESGIEALDGLRITLQAQNLTDEETVQANDSDPRQILQYQTFGRNFLLGFNYQF